MASETCCANCAALAWCEAGELVAQQDAAAEVSERECESMSGFAGVWAPRGDPLWPVNCCKSERAAGAGRASDRAEGFVDFGGDCFTPSMRRAAGILEAFESGSGPALANT